MNFRSLQHDCWKQSSDAPVQMDELPCRLWIWNCDGHFSMLTPPKFNMEPENDDFQKESPFPGADFQVPC